MGVRERWEKKHGSSTDGEKRSENGRESARERYENRQKYAGVDTSGVNDAYFASYNQAANSFFSNKELREDSYDQWQALNNQADTIRAWAWQNRDKLGSNYDKIMSATDLSEAGQYWNQFKTAEDYAKEYGSYASYNEMMNADLGALEQEIADWEGRVSDIEASTKIGYYAGQGRGLGEILDAMSYGKDQLSSAEQQLAAKRAYYNEAKNLQAGKTYGEQARLDPEFANISAKGAVIAPNGRRIENWVAYYRDPKNYDKTASFSTGHYMDNDQTESLESIAGRHMEEDEFATYNYLLGKGDKKSAAEYLKSLEYQLNQREASSIAANLKGRPIAEVAWAIPTGLDQFGSGINSAISSIAGNDGYITPSSIQMSSGMVREDLSDYGFKVFGSSVGQIAYDTLNTTANMAPSILAATAVNMVAPGAGAYVGAGLMGLSAGGNAYAEALNNGYSKDNARAYGLFVGASEAALQSVLGGISSMAGAGNISEEVLIGKANAINNALLRVAAKYGIKIGSETVEEELQNFLEPLFRTIFLGEEYDLPTIEELVQTALVTALSTGALESGGIISSEIGTNKYYKDTYGGSQSELVAEGLELDPQSRYFQRLDEKLHQGKDLTGNEIRNVVTRNDRAIRNLGEAEAAVEQAETEAKQIASETAQNAPKIAQERTEAAAEQTVAKTENKADAESATAEAKPTNENVQEQLAQASKDYGKQAKAMVANYIEGQDVAEYSAAFRIAYDMGASGVKLSYVEGMDSYLTASQRKIAYEAGKASQDMRAKTIDKNNQKAASGGTVRKKGAVRGDGVSIDDLTKRFNDTQRSAYSIMSTIAEVTGIDIVLYKSEADAKGNFTDAQGKYKKSEPGTLYIDINAGLNNVKSASDLANYTMLRTFSHEFVHFIENWNPVWYNELRRVVFDHIENADELIAREAAESGLPYERASREVIAEALTDILPDTGFIEDLSNNHKNIFEKLLEKLKEFVASIKSHFAMLAPNTNKGAQQLKESGKYFEDIVKLYDKVATEAVENYQRTVAEQKVEEVKEEVKAEPNEIDQEKPQKAKKQKKIASTEAVIEEINAKGMVEIDPDGKSVAPQYSRRTWTESEYVTEREKTAKAISKELGVSVETALSFIDNINAVSKLIADDKARLDYAPNAVDNASVLKPNSDYKWSVDMSTLCAKRLLFTGTFDAIQRIMADTAFDSEDIVRLRQMMEERGYEVACGFCYVESTRRELGPITQDFINRYKLSQKTGKPISRINSEGKEVELTKTKEQMKTTVDASTDKFFPEDGYTPTMADLNTTDIDLVKKNHPQVYEAYLNFMNARGQAKPKLLETRAEYKGEILRTFKYKSAVNSRNNAGGLRLQSFSDFEVPHLIDMMQIALDMARVGLKSQAYTKVPAFAKVFGNTGIKINLSLVAKGSGLDADGNLVFDDKEGMPHEEAFRLRDRFSKNVGTILVGKNDAHIIAAMADPRIDFIIPFHKSSWKESLYDALGLTGYEDYTNTQNEKPIDPSREISNFDPSEYWDFSKTGDENAQIYLEKCKEDGRIPKFPQFQGYPGYWKLLIDFKMYDNDGVGSPQEVVRPIYDEQSQADIKEIFDTYKGGHGTLPVAQDIVDDFVKEYKEQKGVQYSRRVNTMEGSTSYELATKEYTLKDIKSLYNLGRLGAEYDVLFDKVYAFCTDANVAFTVVPVVINDQGKEVPGKHSKGVVTLSQKHFNSRAYTNELKSKVILHEMLHAATMYAMSNYYKIRGGDATVQMPKNIYDSCMEINRVFNAIKDHRTFKDTYGIKNSSEMIAELSNPEFVGKLKDTYPSNWHMLLQAICNILGINKSFTNYDKLLKAVEEILAHPDYQLAKDYFAGDGKKTHYLNEAQYAEGATDSDGNTLTEQQEAFFADSKARDADGNLLVLYHGTPNAGFTEFDTSKGRYGGAWFTTSRKDADSYAGNYQHKLFDPAETDEERAAFGGNYTLGSWMRFDTEEDRADFLKAHPDAETIKTDEEYEKLIAEAEKARNWDEAERLEDKQSDHKEALKKLQKAYERYELEHSREATIGELLDNPDDFEIGDVLRAWDAVDRNNLARDNLLDGATKQDLVEGLREVERDRDESESMRDVWFKARLTVGKGGVIVNRANNRTYAVYANLKHPATLQANGNTMTGAKMYASVEAAMKNDAYDGVIVRNVRVGAYEELGDVVVVKNSNQVKLTTNQDPTMDAEVQLQRRDTDYLRAVESGDTEAATRMVEEAAKENGYTEKVYHGTNTFGFTEIDTKMSNDRISFFATDSLQTAGTYSGTTKVRELSEQSNSSLGIYQLYANTDGMLELDAHGAQSNHIALGKSERDFNDYMNTKSWNSFATAKQVAKYAKKAGYTGVIIRNVIDTATPDSRNSSAPASVYVFFDPKIQVKSADAVTYDDDGNVIPLSERFNESGNDIRYQRRDGRMTDQEVLAYAVDMYESDPSSMALSDAEKNAFELFKQRLAKLDDLTAQRYEQGQIYRENTFQKGGDRSKAQEAHNRMEVLDGQIARASEKLLDVKQKTVLQGVLQKARKVVEQAETKRGDEKLKRWRERREEAASIKKYRDRILADRDELINWLNHPLNKDATKHINDNVKAAVIQFLLTIDTSSKQKLSGRGATKADEKHVKQAQKLMEMLNGLDDEVRYSGDYDLPLNFNERLQRHINAVEDLLESYDGDAVLNIMTVDELQDLSILTANLKTALTTLNKFHTNAMFAHVDAAGDNTVRYLRKMKDTDGNAIDNFVMWKNIRPAYAWERFGEGGLSIEQALRAGNAKLGFNAEVIIEFSEKTFTAKEREDWENKVVEVSISDGRKVNTTVAALMSFYELSKRAQGRKHILDGGVTVSDVEIRESKFSKKKRVSGSYGRFTEADIDAMNAKLTDHQKEVADKLQQFMEKQGGEWGNHVTLARFGEKAFGEKGYFPISVDKDSLSSNPDEKNDGAALYRLLNMGFTKKLSENTKQPVVLYSIFDVFSTHMADMAQYNAMALPVLDAIRWLNYKEYDLDTGAEKNNLRRELRRAFGSRVVKGTKRTTGYAESFITGILKSFNGTEAQGTPGDAFYLKLLHLHNRAQIAYNMRVVVQQPTAIIRAAMVLKPKHLIKALDVTKIKANAEEMHKHSGIAVWKSLGYYDVNISRGLTQMIKKEYTFGEKFTEIGTKLAELADTGTWAAMWYACKLQLADQGITDEKQITRLFEDVIYKTQVVDSVLTKSEYMRDKGFVARMTSSFMSEPVATASMWLGAYDKLRMDVRNGASVRQAWKNNRGNLARVAIVFSVSAIINSAIKSVIDGLRDDDDYQTFVEKWLEAFKGNLFDEAIPKLPIIQYFWELVKTAADICLGWDVYGNSPDDVIAQMYGSIKKIMEISMDMADGESNYGSYAIIYKLVQVASGLLGVPLAPIVRSVQTIWNNTAGAFAPSLKIKDYELKPMSEIKYAVLDGYLTADEAADELMKQELVYDREEAELTAELWAFLKDHKEYSDVSVSAYAKYKENCEGIDFGYFYQAWKYYSQTDADRDKDGEPISGSKKRKVLDFIYQMRLTPAQKKQLIKCFYK
jgi:hypothetical protein